MNDPTVGLPDRLGQIALRYQERNIDFAIWTEDDLRKEPEAQNRRLLWSHVRRPPSVPEPDDCLQQLKETQPRTWRDVCQNLGDKIAHWLLAKGHLRIDPNQALTPETRITQIGKEDAS